MPNHPTYDPFHLLIDADSDVFTAELDDDARGDEDPPSVAELNHFHRQKDHDMQAEHQRIVEDFSKLMAESAQSTLFQEGVNAALEAQKASGIGCRVQQQVTMTNDQGIVAAEIFGPAGGDDGVSQLTESSLLGRDLMSVSVGTVISGFSKKRNASTQTSAASLPPAKKNASTQTAHETIPPATTEAAVTTPILPKRERSSVRYPRRCRTCGMDAFFGCWRYFHPYSRKVKGYFVECVTPECQERLEGFPCPRHKRLPKRKR